jgi:hypothetical protein
MCLALTVLSSARVLLGPPAVVFVGCPFGVPVHVAAGHQLPPVWDYHHVVGVRVRRPV